MLRIEPKTLYVITMYSALLLSHTLAQASLTYTALLEIKVDAAVGPLKGHLYFRIG